MHVQTLVQMLYNYKMSGTSLFYILVQICHICLEKSKANPLKLKIGAKWQTLVTPQWKQHPIKTLDWAKRQTLVTLQWQQQTVCDL
jgi:hypothetical protein